MAVRRLCMTLKKIPESIIILLIMSLEISTENILEQISSWETGVYFENGSPELTRECIYENEKNYTFTPKYYVIKSELQLEGNVYISLYNNITEINFRIYEEKHPDYPNYKFNVNSNEIETCSNLNNCEPLYICQVAIGDAVLNNNTIFLSWKPVENADGFNLIILFQYKHRLVKCIDPNAKKIKKIVLEGAKSQQVQSTSLFYKYKKEKSNSTSVKLDLNNSSVAIYAAHEKNCGFTFNLSCDGRNVNTTENITTLSKFAANDVFNSDVNFRGWEKIVLPSSSTNKTSCTLDINTVEMYNENAIINSYWAIAFIDSTEERHQAEGPVVDPTTMQPQTEQSTTEQPSTQQQTTEQAKKTDSSTSNTNETCNAKKNVTEPVECVLALFSYFLGPVKKNSRTEPPDNSKSCPWKIFVTVQLGFLMFVIILFGVPKVKKICCKRN